MNTKIKIFIGILAVCIVLFTGWIFLGGQNNVGLVEENDNSATPTQQISCAGLDEDHCRKQLSCVPLGASQNTIYPEGESESFVFEECVRKVESFVNCEEVVKMTQMHGGSKFSKECRCCCGEGLFCRPEKPYPEK